MTNSQQIWLTVVTAVVVGSAIAMVMAFQRVNNIIKLNNLKTQ